MENAISYFTTFSLTADVNDLDKAKKYFSDLNMTLLLVTDIPECLDKVLEIKWEMINTIDGVIILESKTYLSKNLLDKISNWVKTQCMANLGLNFSSSDFAQTNIDGENVSCSFIYNNCFFPFALMPPQIKTD